LIGDKGWWKLVQDTDIPKNAEDDARIGGEAKVFRQQGLKSLQQTENLIGATTSQAAQDPLQVSWTVEIASGIQDGDSLFLPSILSLQLSEIRILVPANPCKELEVVTTYPQQIDATSVIRTQHD
jgi:hypothetical protein